MNEKNSASVGESTSVGDSINASVRFSFTAQFLEGASIFAKRARDIETQFQGQLEEDLTTEHRALVASAIMQSAAALEAEGHEI